MRKEGGKQWSLSFIIEGVPRKLYLLLAVQANDLPVLLISSSHESSKERKPYLTIPSIPALSLGLHYFPEGAS